MIVVTYAPNWSVIYDHKSFIVQATGFLIKKTFFVITDAAKEYAIVFLLENFFRLI
jgi:hypothetical protein